MKKSRQEEIRYATPVGDLRIRSFCPPEEIRRYAFSAQFGSHAQYRPLYTRRESLEQNSAQPDANVSLAVTDDDRIVGFGVLAYPERGERWAQLEPKVMMEVKAIEVSRRWRSLGVAREIMGMLLRHPQVEEKIVYMVGYSWTWDLEGSGRTAQEYRRLLIRLFEPFGFVELQTNEPNICLKPENIFMGRLGDQVTTEVQHAFKWLRFGITP
jgi:acetoin utilization protein AcuA